MSSINHSLYLSQKSFIARRLNGLPKVCAINTALVLSENASSSFVTSMSYVPSSTSRNTGIQPFWMIGFTVVGKPAATVITSSPGLIALLPKLGLVKVVKARRFADDPLLQKRAWRTPTFWASFLSKSSAYRPVVSQKSKEESTRFWISSWLYSGIFIM